MGPLFIAAQVCGIGGMIGMFISFQAKTTIKIAFTQCIACIFLTTQFLLLGAWTGAALNALSLVRNIIYANGKKKWAQGIIWPIVFSVVNVIFAIFTWADFFSLLPVIALILSNFALRIKNAQVSRMLTFPSSPLWLTYDLHTGAYLSIVTEVLVMSSILLGLWRYRKEKKAI